MLTHLNSKQSLCKHPVPNFFRFSKHAYSIFVTPNHTLPRTARYTC